MTIFFHSKLRTLRQHVIPITRSDNTVDDYSLVSNLLGPVVQSLIKLILD